MPLLHQYEVFVSWENPPSEGWLPIEAAALERTDSDQKMALLCSILPHSALLRSQQHTSKQNWAQCFISLLPGRQFIMTDFWLVGHI